MKLRHIWNEFKYGYWSWGFELYKGKPWLSIGRTWYDGPIWYLHLGPLWINCLPWPDLEDDDS